MDLKIFRKGYILHIIDAFTRFSVSTFVKHKTPSVIIDSVLKKWISVFGTMQGIFSDNGGEFSNDEMREVASVLDVQLHTTAADSPHQNGLCEKVHGIVDNILQKLVFDHPHTDINVLLGWANMAKNSLHMHHGFSSFQLVFGRNPNLPNIMSENFPALRSEVSSVTLNKHLTALHSAREEFIKSEACDKI